MAGALLRLDEETWGERYLRAYFASRSLHGPEEVTWRRLAERVSQITPVAASTLMRLRTLKAEPVGPANRQLMYLVILALGFDPADFGLTEDDASPAWHMPTVRKLLAPKSRKRVTKIRCFTGPAGRSTSPEPVLQAA